MLEAMGLRTGIDLDKLLQAREVMQKYLGDEPVHGNFPKAGVPKGFVAATKARH
jgi:hydroxymethylglutaryl-CoA lyase